MHEILLECDPLVDGLNGSGNLRFAFGGSDGGRDACDLKPPCLSLDDSAREVTECIDKESSNRARLQLAGLCSLHQIPDLFNTGLPKEVNGQGAFVYHVLKPCPDVLVDDPLLALLYVWVVSVLNRLNEQIAKGAVNE